MHELIFIKVEVKDERAASDEPPIAVYCSSLGSLQSGKSVFFFNVGAWLWRGFVEVDVLTCLLCTMLGYRHLPLHDQQLSQYLFSTLFVNTRIRDKTST